MGNYNFKKDLKESQRSVNAVIDYLKEEGCTDISENNDSRYDIKYTTKEGKVMTAEVKNDLMWESTGNVAIEIQSRGKASGIATSIADVWFYVLGENLFQCTPGDLRVYLIRHWDRYRRVSGGDEKSSLLVLLKMDDFLDIFSSV